MHMLSKMIRKNTGFNFKELLQRKRLNKAVELMCETDHKVDCNIFFPRRQDLMSRILVQKQQFACMDHDFFATYNIC